MKYEPKQIPEGINTSQENPLKELFILLAGAGILLTAAFIILVSLSDFFVRFIPVEIEQQWFSASRFDFIQQPEPTREVEEVERYLNQLLGQLHKSQLNQWQPDAQQFTIQLVSSDVPNAFITPGSHIFVTTELLRYVNTENALSMVIAHEMAHQFHRHPLRSMGRGIVIAMAFMMFAGVDGSEWVNTILADSINLGLLAYSRQQEREADETGLKLLTGYYGHSAGSSYFFKQLTQNQDFQQTGVQKYLSTHPNTEERIAYLSEFEPEHHTDSVPLPRSIERLLNSLHDSDYKS